MVVVGVMVSVMMGAILELLEKEKRGLLMQQEMFDGEEGAEKQGRDVVWLV